MRNVDELPVISPDKVEVFRKEAENETDEVQEDTQKHEAADAAEDSVEELDLQI